MKPVPDALDAAAGIEKGVDAACVFGNDLARGFQTLRHAGFAELHQAFFGARKDDVRLFLTKNERGSSSAGRRR